MAPAIPDGTLVLVTRPRPPRPGDTVLLDVGGTLEVHRLHDRIRGRSRSWVVHGGDASEVCGVASEADVLGIVAAPPLRPRKGWTAIRLGLLLRARALLNLLLS
jgi:hypothetical protein